MADGLLAQTPEEKARNNSLLGRVGRGFNTLMNDPRRMAGLAGIAQGLLQAGAVSNRPISYAEAMGMASQGATQNLNNYDTLQAAKSQFGAQETFKDDNGKLFFGTTRRNPTNGAVEPVLVAIDGSGAQPQGKVQMVGSYGLTASESTQKKGNDAAATSTAAADVELRTKPMIVAATERARSQAAKSGDLDDQIIAFEANMPTLQNVVAQLKDLAGVATYTAGGRLVDATIRELGFNATEGATAAAKYSAIVSNQVLPILKATLGSQFTNEERKALEATMGDQSLSPMEKQAQLDAFIEQKVMSLETMRREKAMRGGQTYSPPQQTPAAGKAVNWSDL